MSVVFDKITEIADVVLPSSSHKARFGQRYQLNALKSTKKKFNVNLSAPFLKNIEMG